jgi:hypothetical protein
MLEIRVQADGPIVPLCLSEFPGTFNMHWCTTASQGMESFESHRRRMIHRGSNRAADDPALIPSGSAEAGEQSELCQQISFLSSEELRCKNSYHPIAA